MTTSPIDAVALAARRLDAARGELQHHVDRAREAGSSWAEVGDVLGISRQAAFKRFGRPRDPRDGGTMTTRTVERVVALTEQVVRDIDAGDYDAVRARMPDDVAAHLTRDRVLEVWARVVGDIGNLEDFGESGVELADRTRLSPDDQVVGLVVGDVIAVCEAGEVRARVALDERDQVVGLLLVDPAASDLPF